MKILKDILVILALIIAFTSLQSDVSSLVSLTISRNSLHLKKEPFTLIIFGSTGNLSEKKLFPAIFNLTKDEKLSDSFAIVGVGRRQLTTEEFSNKVHESLEKYSRNKPSDKTSWDKLKQNLFYHQADFTQDEGYESLATLLEEIDETKGTKSNYIFYLATDSSQHATIIEKLSKYKLIHDSESDSFSRVIIEKPIGCCLESAYEFNNKLVRYLDDEQIFFMDHYLGKEGFQKLLKLKFEDDEFDNVLNNNYVKNVQITLSEEIGIESRGAFYENCGHLRDVVQNHAMQLLAILAMEQPEDLTSETIHEEKIKLLNAIRPFPHQDINKLVIRGQYGPGYIKGNPVPGYRKEANVADDSQTETFIQAKLLIDNKRWNGVPFFILSGKRLPKSTTEITINFIDSNPYGLESLAISIHPKAFLTLKQHESLNNVKDNFSFTAFKENKEPAPEAYETLIFECIRGDKSNFVGFEEIISSWRLFTPILEYWKAHPKKTFPNYEAGSWGPLKAEQQLIDNGITWNAKQKA